MEVETITHLGVIFEQMIDSLAVQRAGASNQAVNLVIGLAEEKLREVRAVLTRDPADQCSFHEVDSRLS